jgi:3'(2'), 5'-bisphosphate nucleotidase
MSDYANELQIAIDAVRSAASVCQRVQQTLVTDDTLQKKDKSPVTVADFASQAVVCSALHEHLPTDPVAAEENADELRKDEQAEIRASVVKQVEKAQGQTLGDAMVLAAIDHGTSSDGGAKGRFWTLDPIDGTKGFLRGEQYAIALALIEDGQVVLGVMGCPNLPAEGMETGGEAGVLLTACRGQGAEQLPLTGAATAGRAIHASSITEGNQARFVESVESAHSDHSTSGQVAHRLGIVHEPVRLDSQCKYATVARGEASVYLRMPTKPGYTEKIWDHAAGAIVVEEAGGQVSDIHGQALDFSKGRQLENNTGVVATNGKLHGSVIEAIAATETAGS